MTNLNNHTERKSLEDMLIEEFKLHYVKSGDYKYINEKNDVIEMNIRGCTSSNINICFDEKYDYYLGNKNNEKYYILSKTKAKALYEINKNKVISVNDEKYYEKYYETKSEFKKNIGKIWYDKEEFKQKMRDILGQDKVKVEIKELIEGGATQIILTGAPGTGKTSMAKKIAEEYMGENYPFVQFHPSYDYTDFVEGLRPVDKNGKVTFKKVDGIFKKFCREVVRKNEEFGDNEEKKYFFIIDEINRADLSKVFGELMYGLELDKRGKRNSFNTQYQNLKTYDIQTKKDIENDEFKDGFYIPENIYIIGTMNDIDRSVESMDFALRRRFLWKEIKVDEELLESGLTEIIKRWKNENGTELFKAEEAEIIAKKLKAKISDLNEVIKNKKYNLGEQYCISQGQFANLPKGVVNSLIPGGDQEIEEFLKKVWNLRIKSLLYEYVRGEGTEEKFLIECGSKWGI